MRGETRIQDTRNTEGQETRYKVQGTNKSQIPNYKLLRFVIWNLFGNCIL